MLAHLIAHVPAVAASGIVAAAAKKSSSGGSAVFLIFLVLIAGVYFLFIAPQRRRMRAQMNQQAAYEVGDEVVTKSGIYGTITHMDDERIGLEIAPGTVVEVMKAAIARRVEPVVATEEVDDDDEQAEGSDDEAHDDGGVKWQAPATDAPAAAPGDGTHPDFTEPAHAPVDHGSAVTPEDEPQAGGPA